MKRSTFFGVIGILLLFVALFSGCTVSSPEPTEATQKIQETQKLEPLTYSAEREMLLQWYVRVADPYNVMWVYQFTEGTGQLIGKWAIIGKPVSMRKSLGPKTRAIETEGSDESWSGMSLFGAVKGTPELMNPSGTYGPDLPGIFFVTVDEKFVEIHGGIIIVTEQPINVPEPIINVHSINQEDLEREKEYEARLRESNPLVK
jgi:hypothetical protein